VDKSKKINQTIVIDVILKSFGEDKKLNCTNCGKPIRDHDAPTAHECLELTSLEILSQTVSPVQEITKEVSVPNV